MIDLEIMVRPGMGRELRDTCGITVSCYCRSWRRCGRPVHASGAVSRNPRSASWLRRVAGLAWTQVCREAWSVLVHASRNLTRSRP